MKAQKNLTRIIVAGCGTLIAIAVISIWWGANNVQFFPGLRSGKTQTALLASEEPAEPVLRTDSFGVARGQTARLNVLNCGETAGIIIEWKFLAADGSVLEQGREPVTVAPGRTASFDLNGDALGATRDAFGRIQMRAVIYGLGGPDTFERNAGVSVELIDNATGKSALFVRPAAAKGCSNNL